LNQAQTSIEALKTTFGKNKTPLQEAEVLASFYFEVHYMKGK
jgi:hypothetical protein